MNLFARFFRPAVAKQEVRAEIWRLGSRHLGAPLEGALSELKDPHLSPDRAILLRACVQTLKAQGA
ncbi:hypothetical protein [Phenylobacterium sp.]|uniref:hypothetical protein n=1 Tax=Phenylobacterium sp. TaxID=1871053 RepID=UPI0025CD282C|nr:hypothetical protein [Phenylobacterium sp.]